MQDQIRETYDRLARDYELHVDTQSGHNAYYERPAMMRLLPDDMNELAVLDAGCAAGWYAEQFAKRGARVTAIDLSPAMVDACSRRLGDRAEVFVCDMTETLPFPDETFDLIVSSLTLHYIDDWAPTLREFRRVLKPGGRLLYSVHHPFMDVSIMDESRRDYFAHERLTEVWSKQESGPVEVSFYRRPMQEIVNATAAAFVLESIVEPQPAADAAHSPEASDWHKRWHERLMKHPHFLIVQASKR